MKVAFIADVHLANHARHGGSSLAGINRRALDILESLKAAVALANREGCDRLVVCGDLFDHTRPEPQLLAAAMDELGMFRGTVRILAGNHDKCSEQESDHVLGVFAWLSNEVATTVFDDAPGYDTSEKGVLILVPYAARPAIEHLTDCVQLMESMYQSDHDLPRALAFHAGISDDKTPSWLRGSPDSVDVFALAALMRKYRITWAFAGNWHDSRKWVIADEPGGECRYIYQIGALAPTGWDNPSEVGSTVDPYGTVFILDTAAREGEAPVVEAHVPGPRFVSCPYEGLEAALQKTSRQFSTNDYRVHARVRYAPGQEKLMQSAFETARKNWGHYRFEAVPDPAATQRVAREAASVMRQGHTVDEAVSAWVDQMPLDMGVKRGEVLATVRKYLAR